MDGMVGGYARVVQTIEDKFRGTVVGKALGQVDAFVLSFQFIGFVPITFEITLMQVLYSSLRGVAI